MVRNPIGVATVLLVGLALSTASASADQDRRPEARERRGGGGREDGQRREARGGDRNDRQDRAVERRAQPRPEARVEQRGNRDGDRGRDGDRDRNADRGRYGDRGRDYANVRPQDRRWDNDRRRVDVRPRVVRPTVIVPRYTYRNAPRRAYVTPYGYRPYGYRQGWNANLYFGRPYRSGVYGGPTYGYYALQPGFAYGSLRIVDAPRDAQVFVDGYYAGVVDDYDGIFQHLNLEGGPHHIEIEIDPDAPLIEFDVRIIPGDTVTYRAVLPY
jgi:hypothetical protein